MTSVLDRKSDNDYIIGFTSSVFRRDSVGSITWDDILNVIAFGKSLDVVAKAAAFFLQPLDVI